MQNNNYNNDNLEIDTVPLTFKKLMNSNAEFAKRNSGETVKYQETDTRKNTTSGIDSILNNPGIPSDIKKKLIMNQQNTNVNQFPGFSETIPETNTTQIQQNMRQEQQINEMKQEQPMFSMPKRQQSFADKINRDIVAEVLTFEDVENNNPSVKIPYASILDPIDVEWVNDDVMLINAITKAALQTTDSNKKLIELLNTFIVYKRLKNTFVDVVDGIPVIKKINDND